jgi:hypothetical protein
MRCLWCDDLVERSDSEFCSDDCERAALKDNADEMAFEAARERRMFGEDA